MGVVGGKESQDYAVVDTGTFLEVFAGLPDLGIFFRTSELSGFPMYQYAD
jgi:hypothetical protein